eukprot:gene1432-1773_t
MADELTVSEPPPPWFDRRSPRYQQVPDFLRRDAHWLESHKTLSHRVESGELVDFEHADEATRYSIHWAALDESRTDTYVTGVRLNELLCHLVDSASKAAPGPEAELDQHGLDALNLSRVLHNMCKYVAANVILAKSLSKGILHQITGGDLTNPANVPLSPGDAARGAMQLVAMSEVGIGVMTNALSYALPAFYGGFDQQVNIPNTKRPWAVTHQYADLLLESLNKDIEGLRCCTMLVSRANGLFASPMTGPLDRLDPEMWDVCANCGFYVDEAGTCGSGHSCADGGILSKAVSSSARCADRWPGHSSQSSVSYSTQELERKLGRAEAKISILTEEKEALAEDLACANNHIARLSYELEACLMCSVK